MTVIIILISCILLLIAYVFEIYAKKIKSPAVILMLLLGWLAEQLINALKIEVPDLNGILPVFGTIGLILIVLEGALELQISKKKLPVVKKSFLLALLPILILGFGISFMFHYYGMGSYKDCFANAIPFCIISSAIAIPSVSSLLPEKKEFIVFESSFSDILGVMIFNFVALSHEINIESVELFIAQLIIIFIISIASTIGITFLMSRINYPIKYIPILVIIILVYAISKLMHLPGLVFVLICGLFLGNIRYLRVKPKWKNKLRSDLVAADIGKFKDITVEFTFIIRVMFFVTFGFLIKTSEILNPETIIWAAGITFSIYIIRALFLKISRIPLLPFLFIAPRGLITILLFYLIPEESRIFIVDKSLIIQVILLTILVMMFGSLLHPKEKKVSEINE